MAEVKENVAVEASEKPKKAAPKKTTAKADAAKTEVKKSAAKKAEGETAEKKTTKKSKKTHKKRATPPSCQNRELSCIFYIYISIFLFEYLYSSSCISRNA